MILLILRLVYFNESVRRNAEKDCGTWISGETKNFGRSEEAENVYLQTRQGGILRGKVDAIRREKKGAGWSSLPTSQAKIHNYISPFDKTSKHIHTWTSTFWA